MKTIVITRLPLKSQLGGEELHTLDVALFLREQGFKVVFLSKCPVLKKLAKENDFKFYNTHKLPSSPTSKVSLFFFGLFYGFSLIESLFWTGFVRLRHGQFKFYNLNLADKLLYGFWAKTFGIKSVFLEHATIGKWLTKNPFLIVLKWICRSENIKVVTVSRRMQRGLENTLQTPVFEIRNGVKLQGSLDTNNVNSKQILFIGRLEKDKGFDIVCELAKKNPSLEFVCAGEGSLKHLASDVPNMTLLGFVNHSEIGDLYKNSSMLVLPSTTQDPFGLVVCEALSFGCPVMCSDLVNASDYLDSQFVCRLNEFEYRFLDFYKKAPSRRKSAYRASLEFDQKQMLRSYANFLNSL